MSVELIARTAIELADTAGLTALSMRRLDLIARENLTLYQRHPWLLHVATGRPVLGQNAIAKYDYELRAIDGIGLSDVEMDSVLTLISSYVHGAARGAAGKAHNPAHAFEFGLHRVLDGIEVFVNSR